MGPTGYAPVPGAAFESYIPSAADDDNRDVEHSISSPNSYSTNESPAPYLSLAGRAFTPLSMSADSNDLQYPPDDDGDEGGGDASKGEDTWRATKEKRQSEQERSSATTATATPTARRNRESHYRRNADPRVSSPASLSSRPSSPSKASPVRPSQNLPAADNRNEITVRRENVNVSAARSRVAAALEEDEAEAAEDRDAPRRQRMRRRQTNNMEKSQEAETPSDPKTCSSSQSEGQSQQADPFSRNAEELRVSGQGNAQGSGGAQNRTQKKNEAFLSLLSNWSNAESTEKAEHEDHARAQALKALTRARRAPAEAELQGRTAENGQGRDPPRPLSLSLQAAAAPPPPPHRPQQERRPLSTSSSCVPSQSDNSTNSKSASGYEAHARTSTSASTSTSTTQQGLVPASDGQRQHQQHLQPQQSRQQQQKESPLGIQQSREEDGAEISANSNSQGHAGSTPLSISALLQSPSSAARKNQLRVLGKLSTTQPSSSSSPSSSSQEVKENLDSTTAAAADDALARKSSCSVPPLRPLATKVASPTASPDAHLRSKQTDVASHPSSPTSLIEQIQETLNQSTPASPTDSATSPTIHRPLVRTTSDSKRFTVRHPVPDLNHRSGAYVGNIHALEKTAERLSMTSSIDDAIRDLHGELKRSDSRRSSILASSIKEDATEGLPSSSDRSSRSNNVGTQRSRSPSLARHISSASNIVEVNNAARFGGYSPAGYIMSPNNSLTSRMRSGSKNSTGRPDFDVDNYISRHGPGKSSTRSVRSSKLSLAEIAEAEPTTGLNQGATSNADQTPLNEDEAAQDLTRDMNKDNTMTANVVQPEMPQQHQQHQQQQERPDTPNTDAFHNMLSQGAFQGPGADLRLGHDDVDTVQYAPRQPQVAYDPRDDDRPSTRRSSSTFDVFNAFGDFDGVHCEPDFDLSDMPEPVMPEPRGDMPDRSNQPRPHSYYDEESGNQMLYYPARVPAMLNLPPKLSSRTKAVVRNARHSKVLKAMGHTGAGQPEYMDRNPDAAPVRESTLWLPDFESEAFSPFPDSESQQQKEGDATKPEEDAENEDRHSEEFVPGHSRRISQPYPGPQEQPGPLPPSPHREFAVPANDEQQPGKQSKRKSLLDPRLRASAFFDLPSTSPEVEVKDGSAMATLDSILDASANAPVHAFTDHMYAGKLGHEVYGAEKKKKKNRKSTGTLLEPSSSGEVSKAAPLSPPTPKRRSFFGFGKKEAAPSVRSGKGKERPDDDEASALAGSVDGEERKKDGDEEEDSGDAASDNSDELPDGPPTTLLAELQLRKHQQKQRTRNLHLDNPDGMQSTLLELDAVAEAQHKNRKKTRVNLAWEDPDGVARDGGANESDDDDVPLGLLYGGGQAERPIGLMEKREIEENEPLSARRARLQGRETMTLGNRRSMLSLNPNAGMSSTRLPRMPSPQRSPSRINIEAPANDVQQQEDEESDVEGETMGERMRRLRAKEEAEHNNLPRARPVSSVFSTELLSQFGDKEEPKPDDAAGKSVGSGSRPGSRHLGLRGAHSRTGSALTLGVSQFGDADAEEEETLGQRRKRLQAEREAREREMGTYGAESDAAPPSLNHKLSLADTLGAYPNKSNHVQERKAQQQKVMEERARMREQNDKMAALRSQMPQEQDPSVNAQAEMMRMRSQEEKMAAMRASMPQSIHTPSSGPKAGGFMGGTYNNGAGGGSRKVSPMGPGYGVQMNAARSSSMGLAGGYPQQQQQQMNMAYSQMNGGVPPPVYSQMGGYNMPMNMSMPQLNMSNSMGMGIPQSMSGNMSQMNVNMGMPMNMQQQQQPGPPAQMNSIERWRQSVMP